MSKFFFNKPKSVKGFHLHTFADREEAKRFLTRAVADSDALHALRMWNAHQSPGVTSDRELLERCALALACEDVTVHERLKLRGSAPLGNDTPVEPINPSAERVTPSSMRRPSRGSAPAPEALKEKPMDVDGQIAALQAAAESGAPFCEMCAAKAAQAQGAAS